MDTDPMLNFTVHVLLYYQVVSDPKLYNIDVLCVLCSQDPKLWQVVPVSGVRYCHQVDLPVHLRSS